MYLVAADLKPLITKYARDVCPLAYAILDLRGGCLAVAKMGFI